MRVGFARAIAHSIVALGWDQLVHSQKILPLFYFYVVLLQGGNFVATLGLIGGDQADLNRARGTLVL
jgi:hypothetical protein